MNLPDSQDLGGEVGPQLQPRLERLSALRSAWSVLAPSGLSDIAHEIAETGRVITDYFLNLTREQDQLDAQRLAGLDALIDEFDMSMRLTASRAPVPLLRTTLPAFLASQRQGLLDLLDVFIGADLEADRSSDGRIYAIDYMITLLCYASAEAGSVIRHDPVTLTPRLHALSQHSDATNDPALADAAATFFGAANLDADQLREEIQQRALRTHKAELGGGFFSSNVLRAIVTYNAALIKLVAGEIIDTGNIAVSRSRDRQRPNPASVYDSKPLRAIAEAMLRRTGGGAPEPQPVDRIAWALDLDSLTGIEKRALQNEAVCTRENVIGTAILVGLINRSLAILSIDIQEADMSPDEISDGWIAELDGELQIAINDTITSDDYKTSVVISELRQKFLSNSFADEGTEKLPPKPAESGSADPLDWNEPTKNRERASDIVRHALEEADAGQSGGGFSWNALPWVGIGRAALVIAMMIAAVFFLGSLRDGDLDSWNSDELASVSPYLDQGRRNGSGLGPAFVGRIDDDWLVLSAAQREASAADLVLRLKELGIQQVMIYDSNESLRIQSIGSQTVRVL